MEKYFASDNIDGDGIWEIIIAATIKSTTFSHLRSRILEAWKDNKLYTVYEIETRKIIPCFTIWSGTSRKSLDLIWVTESKRELGLATLMIKEINPDVIFDPLPKTIKFWKKRGYVTQKDSYLLKSPNPIDTIEELT